MQPCLNTNVFGTSSDVGGAVAWPTFSTRQRFAVALSHTKVRVRILGLPCKPQSNDTGRRYYHLAAVRFCEKEAADSKKRWNLRLGRKKSKQNKATNMRTSNWAVGQHWCSQFLSTIPLQSSSARLLADWSPWSTLFYSRKYHIISIISAKLSKTKQNISMSSLAWALHKKTVKSSTSNLQWKHCGPWNLSTLPQRVEEIVAVRKSSDKRWRCQGTKTGMVATVAIVLDLIWSFCPVSSNSTTIPRTQGLVSWQSKPKTKKTTSENNSYSFCTVLCQTM